MERKINTNSIILKNDILALGISFCFLLIEFFQRGVSIYVTAFLAISYAVTVLVVKLKSRLQNSTSNNPMQWEKGVTLVSLCLIASLTTTLLGYTSSLNEFKILLIPLSLVAAVNYRKSLLLLKSSKSISLYLLYCLWIILTLCITRNQSPLQLEFYLIIGAQSFVLALLISKSDLSKKTLGFTLALAVILTTYQRGLTQSIDPPNLLITYKNIASIVGIMSIVILLSLKPKNSFSLITNIIISITAVAILATPSQAGRLSLIAIVCYTLWLYSYRLCNNKKLLQKLLIVGALTTIATATIGIGIYHKEISIQLGKKETLGGRTKIWESAYDWILLSPTTGYSGSFWFNQGGSAASNHHHEYVNRGYNGFLDTLIQSGFLGLMLLIALLLTLVIETRLRWGEKMLLLSLAFLSLITETHSFAGTFLIQGGTTVRAVLIFWVAICLSQNTALCKKRN